MLNQNRPNPIFAGFFVRLSAFLIDTLIVSAALSIIKIPTFFISLAAPDLFFLKPLLFSFSLLDIILYILSIAYFIILTYTCGATIGKRLMKIRVIKANFEKLTLFDVIYRESIGRYLSSVIIFIGYFLIGPDTQKRALHDILCDTRVIYTLSSET